MAYRCRCHTRSMPYILFGMSGAVNGVVVYYGLFIVTKMAARILRNDTWKEDDTLSAAIKMYVEKNLKRKETLLTTHGA